MGPFFLQGLVYISLYTMHIALYKGVKYAVYTKTTINRYSLATFRELQASNVLVLIT